MEIWQLLEHWNHLEQMMTRPMLRPPSEFGSAQDGKIISDHARFT